MEELVPRKSLKRSIDILDIFMPWAVILSIIGLIIEYTFINKLGPLYF